MTLNRSSILTIALAAALPGCSTVGQGISENLKVIPSGKGMVLFSTSADQTSASFSTHLTLVEGSTLKRYDKVVVQIDYPFNTSHFGGGLHGHARTLTLPAGDYYFMPTSTNPYFGMQEAPIFKFKVASGQVSYLGNIHLAGRSLQATTKFYERDVALFQQKNPDLAALSITRSAFEKGPKLSEFRINGVIWDAPQ